VPKNFNFKKAKRKLPENGPGGAKHICANVVFKSYMSYKAFVGEKNFDLISDIYKKSTRDLPSSNLCEKENPVAKLLAICFLSCKFKVLKREFKH
jgi:hypothetical protein